MNITTILIAITVGISMLAFSKESVLRACMMNPWLIFHRKQYYRFLSSGFIHGSHMHLIVNMISFYFFGKVMEDVFHALFGDLGGVYFIALYFIGIIVSDIPTFFKQKDNPQYNSLGASGGVASVIFAFILFLPLEKIYLFFIPVGVPGFLFGFLYVGYSWYQGRKSADNINHDAHLYGAFFGLIFCAIVYPQCIPRFISEITHWISTF